MANYTAADIKALREKTAAGMMDVKKALDEADGDMTKADEILRVKGLKGVTKREGRTASNGLVTAQASGGVGTLVEVLCETDFVAKGERFIALADEVLDPGRGHQGRGRGRAARIDARGRPDRQGPARRGQRDHRREDRGPARGPPRGRARRVATCTRRAPTCPRRSVSSWRPTVATSRSRSDVAMHIAAISPTVLTRDEVDGRHRRERASDRRGDRQGGGQARGRPAAHRRGARQRLLQGQRPARAAVRQGAEEDRRAGPRGVRGRRHGLRPLPVGA